MRILVFNSGSSSLKFQLFEISAAEPVSIISGAVKRLGTASFGEWRYGETREQQRVAARDHREAAEWVFDFLENGQTLPRPLLDTITATGHRVVHGGERFIAPVPIDERALTELESLNSLAPQHNPPALAVMGVTRVRLGDRVPMVAVFDTAFFADLPDYARSYALPAEWAQTQGIRRYGFHGLAHRYMDERYRAMAGAAPGASRIITLQLGHGCSAAAIRGGEPVETSMGFTPLEGLIMATRPGDVDAGILLHMMTQHGYSPARLDETLQHRSGLLGLSGASDDMQELLRLEARGHAGAALAVSAYCHRVRKYVGAYLAVLGGADAIVFGGGVGEHAHVIRARICESLAWCGLKLDTEANRAAAGAESRISAAGSVPAAYVIPVNEELLIARDVRDCLTLTSAPSTQGAPGE